MTKRTGKSRFSPTQAEVDRRGKQGYFLASTLADKYDISPSSVYGWAKTWSAEKAKLGGLPVAFKRLGHLWVLEAAVEARTADPVAAAR